MNGSKSPTRLTAVKFLMTSPENPFGVADTEEDEYGVNLVSQMTPERNGTNRFNSARRNTYGGQTRSSTTNAQAASPESGVKATMYSQLQEEIKQEARRKSGLDPRGSSFQFVMGARSKSPSVSNQSLCYES